MIASKSFARTPLTKVAMVTWVALAVLAGVGIYVWQRPTSTDPKTVFEQAVQHGLRETDLTCTVQETTGGSTTKQAISLDLVSRNKLRSVLNSSPTPGTSVELEEIDTPAGIFVRYNTIKTTEKNADGKTPNLSKALNVWGKAAPDSKGPTLFGRTAFGNCIVPLAHLNHGQADTLMADVKKGTVFKTDFAASASRQQLLDGKTVRVYDVVVQPRPYLEFMKRAAKATGSKDLDSVNVATFDQKSPEKMKFYIDVRSHRLRKIEFTAKRHTITFSEYGTIHEIMTPKSSISSQELQKRLQTN